MANNYSQPSYESEPDEDQGDQVTLLAGQSSPESAKPKTTPVSVSSDSGYSSFSKTSSKASTGKTVGAPRASSRSSASKAQSSNKTTNAPTKTAPPASYKPTKSSSRSQSKVRDPSLSSPAMSAQDQAEEGYWKKVRRSDSSSQAPRPAPTAQQPVLAPSVPHTAPPPAAVPRRRPAPQPVPQQRPFSVAAPNVLAYAYQQPAPPPRPPSVLVSPSTQPIPIPMAPPPQSRPPPQEAQGEWIRRDKRQSYGAHPPPPSQPRPPILHRATDAAATASRRSSMYGGPPVTQYISAPTVPYHEQARLEMPPPPAPQYPSRSSSRRPADESHSRRMSQSYGHPEYFNIDPNKTIRAPPVSSRPSVYPKSKSATYARERYPGTTTMIERTTQPMGNYERVRDYVQQAQEYQEASDRHARRDSDSLATEMSFLQLDSSPTSSHHRRPSVSQPPRSVSRAGSSVSRRSNDTGPMRIGFKGNAVEISGSLEGQSLSIIPDENGQPLITVGGSGSPTKTRERPYYPGESVRSNASFSERMRRPGSGDSTADGPTLVSSNVSRRQSTVGRRESRGHHR